LMLNKCLFVGTTAMNRATRIAIHVWTMQWLIQPKPYTVQEWSKEKPSLQ